jgi:Holliday junction resolvasome RuvABC DNA-binding subunit
MYGIEIWVEKERQKSRAETEKKAHEDKIESVKSLIEMGLSDSQISKAMKMTEKEVADIKEGIKSL